MIRITRIRRGKFSDLRRHLSFPGRSHIALTWTPREKWIESDDDRRLFERLLEQSERIAREAVRA